MALSEEKWLVEHNGSKCSDWRWILQPEKNQRKKKWNRYLGWNSELLPEPNWEVKSLHVQLSRSLGESLNGLCLWQENQVQAQILSPSVSTNFWESILSKPRNQSKKIDLSWVMSFSLLMWSETYIFCKDMFFPVQQRCLWSLSVWRRLPRFARKLAALVSCTPLYRKNGSIFPKKFNPVASESLEV